LYLIKYLLNLGIINKKNNIMKNTNQKKYSVTIYESKTKDATLFSRTIQTGLVNARNYAYNTMESQRSYLPSTNLMFAYVKGTNDENEFFIVFEDFNELI
jgi:hypothetical protein